MTPEEQRAALGRIRPGQVWTSSLPPLVGEAPDYRESIVIIDKAYGWVLFSKGLVGPPLSKPLALYTWSEHRLRSLLVATKCTRLVRPRPALLYWLLCLFKKGV